MRSTRSSTAPAASSGRARWRSPASATARSRRRSRSKDMLREKGPGVYLAVVERTDLRQDEYAEPATNWVLVSNLGLTAYNGTRRDGGRCPLARRRQADVRCHGSALRAQQRRAGRGDQRRRRDRAVSPAACCTATAATSRLRLTGAWPRRRLQFSRDRPPRLRPERPRRQRPAATRVRSTRFLYTDRGIYRPGRDGRADRAGARRQGRGDVGSAGRTCGCCGRTGSRSSSAS